MSEFPSEEPEATDAGAPTGARIEAGPAAEPPHVPDVVVGWVQAGPLDDTQREAFNRARALVREALQRELPGFAWSFPFLRRRDLVTGGAEAEPVDLLDAGVTERRVAGWDFALVVTAADLRARFRPFALATPAQALDTAALSMARIDPGVRDSGMTDAERAERMGYRLAALALHAFGHLNGLDHEAREDAVMHAPRSPSDLDLSSLSFTEPNRTEIEAELHDVADPRLEEETAFERLSDAAFVVKAILLNWADVADTVVQIRPWRFPFQLSKLTTAAFSTLVVLVMTAEAWDLGTRQPVGLVLTLSAAVLVIASVYLVRKQRLMVHRRSRRRSEQRVVAEASVLLAVGIGMATTYALLFVSTLALAGLLFDRAILEGWAATLGESIATGHIVVFASFVATIGLAVGALGASFEEQTYFRHVALVDEET